MTLAFITITFAEIVSTAVKIVIVAPYIISVILANTITQKCIVYMIFNRIFFKAVAFRTILCIDTRSTAVPTIIIAILNVKSILAKTITN